MLKVTVPPVAIPAAFGGTTALVATLVLACNSPPSGRTAPLSPLPAPPASSVDVPDEAPEQLPRIAIGSRHLCWMRDSDVQCRGTNDAMQLGLPSAVAAAQVLTGAVSVCAGYDSGCALGSDGAVRCWGGGTTGVHSVDGVSGVVELACGREGVCTRDRRDRVSCWDRTSAPDALPNAPSRPRVLALGGGHGCAVLEDGALVCWGRNGDGQLGDGTTEDRVQPSTVTGPREVIGVRAGMAHTCAVTQGGHVWCWGWNPSGQIGQPATEDTPNPVPARVPGLTGAIALALGHAHSCALRKDGTVWCWGDDDHCQLGAGEPCADRAAPKPVKGLRDAVEVAAGSDKSCARRRDGAILCWGDNGNYEIVMQPGSHVIAEPTEITASPAQ